MTRNPAPVGGFPPFRRGQRRFDTTRSSLVLRARADGEGGADAVGQLCRQYWGPVRAFFVGQGAREDEADDVTQGFFEALHRRQDFAKVEPGRGRFRAWLCACAKHYLYNVRDHERSLKAGGGQQPLSLDAVTEPERALLEPREVRTPEHLFNRDWALALHTRVIQRLRAHYAACGQLEVFRSLEGLLSGEGAEQSDSDLSARLGKRPGALRTERCRMNKGLAALYRRYLRAEIGETVSNPEDIDDEIRELLAALSQPAGVLCRGREGAFRVVAGAERRADTARDAVR
jgi:DNA-directed RNA polymerase specialized sigma24 family protein